MSEHERQPQRRERAAAAPRSGRRSPTAAASAPRKPLTAAPGTIHAATSSADGGDEPGDDESEGSELRPTGAPAWRFVGLFGGSHSRVLDGDSRAGPYTGPHPNGVMNLAAPRCSILGDVL